MSRKKFDEKCYKETMDCLHASGDVLEEVLKMTENRNAEGDKIQDDGQETRNRSKYDKNNDSQNRHWHPARVARNGRQWRSVQWQGPCFLQRFQLMPKKLSILLKQN